MLDGRCHEYAEARRAFLNEDPPTLARQKVPRLLKDAVEEEQRGPRQLLRALRLRHSTRQLSEPVATRGEPIAEPCFRITARLENQGHLNQGRFQPCWHREARASSTVRVSISTEEDSRFESLGRSAAEKQEPDLEVARRPTRLPWVDK